MYTKLVYNVYKISFSTLAYSIYDKKGSLSKNDFFKNRYYEISRKITKLSFMFLNEIQMIKYVCEKSRN